MKRDLWGSLHGRPIEKEAADAAPQPDADTMRAAEAAYARYSGMDEAALLRELEGFQKSGAMDAAALSQMAQTVAPMLNREQQAKLQALLARFGR